MSWLYHMSHASHLVIPHGAYLCAAVCASASLSPWFRELNVYQVFYRFDLEIQICGHLSYGMYAQMCVCYERADRYA